MHVHFALPLPSYLPLAICLFPLLPVISRYRWHTGGIIGGGVHDCDGADDVCCGGGGSGVAGSAVGGGGGNFNHRVHCV
eukprot:1346652-Amphidinium_carterae.1